MGARLWWAVAFLLFAQQSVAELDRLPVHALAAEDRGPYDTGTFEESWVDEARKDPSTAAQDDPRRLMVQVWYPAVLSDKKRLAPYVIHPELYASDSWSRRLGHVQTRSALDAPLATGVQPFPVILYSHGREFSHFSGTFLTEFLASHGYVVVAIGHTGVNGLQRFPDGTAYKEDGVRYSNQYSAASALSDVEQQLASREQFELLWKRADLGLYLQDVSFVLDRLRARNENPRDRFHGRLDLDHVGMVGWSLGGIIAFQATRSEPRIRAAVNLDGWPFGWLGPDGVVTRGSERPLLLMNGKPPNPDLNGMPTDAGDHELMAAAELAYWTLFRRSTQDWYRVLVSNASHMSFSDLPLFERQAPEAINPYQAHRIVDDYTLEFFDKYLRGREQTPLLEGKQRYPEAELLRQQAVTPSAER